MSFPNIPNTLNTSDNNLTSEFYTPCFKWANQYDRGVGYFTSGWLTENSEGMSDFASRGGIARWITSPIIEERDLAGLMNGTKKPDDIDLFKTLKNNVEELRKHMEIKTQNVIGWLIYDEILDFKFAVPRHNLDGGDFHDKFGIFQDDEGNKLSFIGSINDSKKGYINYESLKVFSSWKGMTSFIEDDILRFNKLWNNHDENVRVYDLPEAIKEDVFRLRNSDRPYKKTNKKTYNKWKHQDEAAEAFLATGNGVLEMATGTGKTRTALQIVNQLISSKKINNVVITVSGTDLLEQWCSEVSLRTNLTVYRQFSGHKEFASFKIANDKSALIISRDFLKDSINYMSDSFLKKSIIVCDEVHGFGAPSIVNSLSGKIKDFKYRLGLSATPERDYDESGNNFIKTEIGEKVYEFKIEDAIKRGILCEFDYHPLEFELTEDDKKKVKKIIGAYQTRKKLGKPVRIEDLYRDLARVKKVSEAKIPVFFNFLKNNPEILNRSIIFVETKEFGEKIQNMIIRYESNYHTYYGEDDRNNLIKFSDGTLNCLITSKRISEGIDIRSVNNIILFSADRARIQTIQRIGRSLRTDPSNPDKKASVVDFIKIDNDTDTQEGSDKEREAWLSEMSNVVKESEIYE